jgi:hypothetical protein
MNIHQDEMGFCAFYTEVLSVTGKIPCSCNNILSSNERKYSQDNFRVKNKCCTATIKIADIEKIK